VSDVVVDSSVVAKWVLPEADSAQAEHLLLETTSQGGALLILYLALVEAANAIWKRCHQGLIVLDEARRLLDCLLRIPVRIEPARDLLPSALHIAVTHDRAVYDALFVALAEKLGLQGVTADEPLYTSVRTAFPKVALLRDWRPL